MGNNPSMTEDGDGDEETKSSSPKTEKNEGGGGGAVRGEVFDLSEISAIMRDEDEEMDLDASFSFGDEGGLNGDNGNQSPTAECSYTAVSPRMKRKTTPSLSASTSLDEHFKYKISIYSKVRECRMTDLPDYTIIKQIRVVALQHVANGDPEAVLKIKFAYEKMKNGGLQVITDDKGLYDALGGLSYFSAIPCKMTFPNSPRVVGFVKDLPANMEPAELKREIRKTLPEVYSVRSITGRSTGKIRPMQRPCAFVSFNLRYLPGFVRVYGKDYEILVPNPMQCTRCCRYGHQGKQCRAEVRCPICGKAHSKHACTSQVLRCVNCKGAHPSTSHECVIWQQGKLMNELRYRGGLTAEEAIDVASNGTIQHKEHSFISPDEYFDNLESFCLKSGNGSGNGSGSSDDTDPLNMLLPNDSDLFPREYHNEETPYFFHPRFVATQEFLDLMTDFFLRVKNPDKNYTSSILMPGFEEDSVMQRLYSSRSKKPSRIAQLFKLSVIQALQEDNQEKLIEASAALSTQPASKELSL